jgi:hypothetical protein
MNSFYYSMRLNETRKYLAGSYRNLRTSCRHDKRYRVAIDAHVNQVKPVSKKGHMSLFLWPLLPRADQAGDAIVSP